MCRKQCLNMGVNAHGHSYRQSCDFKNTEWGKTPTENVQPDTAGAVFDVSNPQNLFGNLWRQHSAGGISLVD